LPTGASPAYWPCGSPHPRNRPSRRSSNWTTAACSPAGPQLAASRPGLTLITDKGFAGRAAEADLGARRTILLRPSRKGEQARHGEALLKSVRQLIDLDPLQE